MAWVERRTTADGTVSWKGIYRDRTGRRQSKTFDLRRDAKAWADQAEADARRAEGEIDRRAAATITVADLAPVWLASKRKIKPVTRHGYVETFDYRVAPRWGDWLAAEIRRVDVEEWIDDMAREGLSAARIRQCHQLLHALLKFAVHKGVIATNPATEMDLPALRPKPLRWLDPDEIDMLAAALEDQAGEWAATWCFTAAYGGLRFSETAALRGRHVLEDLRRLDIRDGHAAGVDDTAKTTGGVDLPRWVARRLADHKTKHGIGPSSLVFPAPQGGALHYRNFRRRVFDPAVRTLGWDPSRDGGVTPHALRHTCATVLIAGGAHPKVIQQQMRHSSIDVTMNVYGHLMEGMAAAVWDQIDQDRGRGDVVDLDDVRRRRAQ